MNIDEMTDKEIYEHWQQRMKLRQQEKPGTYAQLKVVNGGKDTTPKALLVIFGILGLLYLAHSTGLGLGLDNWALLGMYLVPLAIGSAMIYLLVRLLLALIHKLERS